MIKSLEIKNFQSHKDTRIQFDPGVNIIVGSTDSGKSAIIRALRWAVENKPNGTSLQSNWGGETRVMLKTDQATVIRIKDKRDELLLGPADGTHLVMFKAFGVSVPKEVSEALNIGPINLQRQIDSPFLFSESPGAVAEHFNKIANIEVLDRATQNIKSQITSTNSGIGYAKGQMESFTKDMEQFEYLEKFEIELEVLEGLQNRMPQLHANVKKLSGAILTITSLEEFIENKKEILLAETSVDEAIELIDKRDNVRTNIQKITEALKTINAIEDHIEKCMELILAESEVDAVGLLIAERTLLRVDLKGLENNLYNIEETEKDIKTGSFQVSTLQKLFKKEMPDVCPLCDTNLNDTDSYYGDLEGLHKHFRD